MESEESLLSAGADRNGSEEDRSEIDLTAPASPSSSSILTDVEAIDDGRLDVSNRDLTKLPKLPTGAPHVRVLSVSGNCLKSFDGIRRYIGCEEIDASDNKIHSIGALLCVKETLKILNVSRNELLQCEQISAFHALVNLDLSKNNISLLPVLHSLPNLRVLNLSSNELTALPSLHQVENLSELNVNSNQITSLETAKSCLPPGLELLDVGNNKITDLTNVVCLSGFSCLGSLTFEDNPAVNTHGRGFCYRPYLASCLPESLKVVDGLVLNDLEIVKGEWLCTQGKSSRIKPGTNSHVALCEYLTKVLEPTAYPGASAQSPLESNLIRIIEHRRRYEEQRSCPTSVGSISASMIESSLRKDSSARRLSDASDSTIIVSSAHQSVVSAGGLSTPVPVIRSTSASLSSRRPQKPDSITHRTTPKLPSASTSFYSCHPRTPVSSYSAKSSVRSLKNRNGNPQSTPTTPSVRKDCNTKISANRLTTLNDEKQKTPASTAKSLENSRRLENVVKIQRWWRAVVRRRRVWSFSQSKRFEALQKNQKDLQKRFLLIAEDNERLTRINEEQTAAIADLVEQFLNLKNESMRSIHALREEHSVEIRQLNARLHSMEMQFGKIGVPKPSSLRLLRQGGHNVLTWENVPLPNVDVAHYNFYTNGKLCGTAKARLRRIILTDTQPGDEITVEAVSTAGTTSLSDPLICTYQSKENIP